MHLIILELGRSGMFPSFYMLDRFFLLYGTETVPAMQKKYQLLNFTENKKKKQTNKSQPQIIFAFRIQNMVHYALND